MKLKILLAILLAMGFSMTASASVHEVVANFDDGNTDLAPDGFVGKIGSGWTDRWKLPMWTSYPTTTGTVITPSDTGFNEVSSGGGNYLSVHLQDTATVGIGRDFTISDLDVTQPYTIEFSYRVDDGFDESFNSSNDRIQFFNSDEWRSASDAGCSWIVGAYGGATTWMTAENVGYWLFFDGNNDGAWTAAQQVNSGIAVTEGVTYDFSIYVDPINLSYTPSVTDTSTGTTVTSPTALGWRTSASSMPAEFTLGAKLGSTGDFLDYSVDNVRVWQDATGILPIGGMSEVVANFDGGNATDVVDAFTGIAGNGWAGPWEVNLSATNETLNASAGVVASSDAGFQELHPNDGNYLQLTLNDTENPINGTVSRDYKNIRPGIDWRESHTVDFTIRIDETGVGSELSALDTYTDRYAITGSNAARSSSSTEDMFLIMATGDPGSWGDQIVEKWAFADGNGAGGIDAFVGSGIDLVEGGVYDFSVTINPEDQTWDVTVTDGTNTFTATDLGWRTSSDFVGGVLNFGGQSESGADIRAMSIDNIRITQVPEPSTVALLTTLLLGLLFWHKKRD